MPLELIVIAFVIVAFVAVAARFMPRDASGARRLPRIVDESVGMYMVRRALGRPTEAASDRESARIGTTPTDEAAANARAAEADRAAIAATVAAASADPSEGADARRSGVPGTPRPMHPTRYVVSSANPQAHRIHPVVLIAMRPVVVARSRARRSGPLPLQRGLAGIATLGIVILVAFAALSQPRGPDGEVASATGTPGTSPTPAASDLAFVPAPSDELFATGEPTRRRRRRPRSRRHHRRRRRWPWWRHRP